MSVINASYVSLTQRLTPIDGFKNFNANYAITQMGEISPPFTLPVDPFDELVHWVAHLIASFSVTVSLLFCMAVILFSCLCLFELAIQCVNEAIRFMREEVKIF